MSSVPLRYFGRLDRIPSDATDIRGPYRDEHRFDGETGRQAEDLFTFQLDRGRPGRLPEPVVAAGLWVHVKGGLYLTDGYGYSRYSPVPVGTGELRIAYVSLDYVIRPGTRRSLRQRAEFEERFVYLGPSFPVNWTAAKVDQVLRHLGPNGLEKLRGFTDPEGLLEPLFRN